MGRDSRLSPRQVATEKRPGMHADGAGLYLQVTHSWEGPAKDAATAWLAARGVSLPPKPERKRGDIAEAILAHPECPAALREAARRTGDKGRIWLATIEQFAPRDEDDEGPAISKSWIFRYKRGGKASEMGLGSENALGLAEARDRARDQRKLLADGLDPIEERSRIKQAAAQARQAAEARKKSFKFCAESYIDAHRSEWRNAKHAAQWRSTLETYAYPIIGEQPVQEINTDLVLAVLRQEVPATKRLPAGPLWTTRRETAGRLRGRIEKALAWATQSKFRTGDNPAAWSALTDLLAKARNVRHMPALPYAELPAFMIELRQQEGDAARALELAILCANRTTEAIGARWSEIDAAEKAWTVPAEHMKSKRPHRIPLSDRALEIIERQRGQDATFVFPGRHPGASLSDMALLMLLRRMGREDITTHGFRSTFKDWCRERSNFPNELSEAALAHVIGDKTEAAYARGTLFDKRRGMMAAWARYCASTPAARGAVVRMAAGRA
jgi:integrase